MLVSLGVRNFAIVDRIEVEFGPGMTVLTGETGAGKSILIDALAGDDTITVGPTDIVTTAHNRLRNAGFSQLPVMEDGRLVGVITEDTIIQYVFGKPDLMKAPVADA